MQNTVAYFGQKMKPIVALVKLVAKYNEDFGYITYVFECLEKYMIEQSKYIMCVQFPNWEQKEIKLGDIGYLEFRELRAGIDKWFDGEKQIPYNYDIVQFIKFIEKPEDANNQFIM